MGQTNSWFLNDTSGQRNELLIIRYKKSIVSDVPAVACRGCVLRHFDGLVCHLASIHVIFFRVGVRDNREAFLRVILTLASSSLIDYADASRA